MTSPTQNREWSGLPDLVLLAVLHHLSALLDLFAFGGVCQSWRSVFKSSAGGGYVSAQPPLLLRPTLPRRRSVQPRPSEPLGCHLQTLGDGSSYKSLLSDQALADPCLGHSYGHLILLRLLRPVLADALTGVETHLPELPPDRYPYYYGVLTSPPSSPDSLLLLFYSKYALLCLRLSSGGWSRHRLGPGVSFVVRVLSFKGRLYAVNDRAKLLAFDFSPDLSVKLLEVGGLCPMPRYDRWQFGPQLIDCRGELLLVLFVKEEGSWSTRIDAFRIDFKRMVWVAVESLGDHALFIDCGGRCPVSCINPGCWGGRANCVYLMGPGFDTCSEFPLGTRMIGNYLNSTPFPSNLSMPRWPSPIWVYPSLFY